MKALARVPMSIFYLTFALPAAASAQTVLSYSGGYSSVPMSDVNFDGTPDYATGGYNFGEVRSGVDGSLIRGFGPFFNMAFTCGTETSCVAAGDLNGDGVEDVIFAMPGDQCKFF